VPFDPDQPLREVAARKLLSRILVDGTVVFSAHALEELENDDMSEQDAFNVLRAGQLDPAEFEKGSWRYRVHTQRFCVVTCFDSETLVVVITAWRKR
jgi:hypothetical protein